MFRIVHGLATSTPIKITLLTTEAGTTPSATPASQVRIDDFVDAVQYAHTHDIDVLVFNNARRPDIIEGIHRAEQFAQPCIAWCQNDPTRSMADRYAASQAVRRVFCVSHPHADVYRDKKVFDKIEVVHNAIDTNWYRSGSEIQRSPQTACYVGALTPDKGFHHVARAWPRVRAALPEARLIVVGSARLYDRSVRLGPLQIADAEYEHTHLVPYLGSSRNEAEERLGVTFRGLLPPVHVRSIMQSASVGVVNPNVQTSLETFCVTAAEMQAANLPVVGAKRKGLRETILDEETGLLIRDPDQLAATMLRLLTNPEQAHRMGNLGQKRVAETFDLDLIVERWHHLLEAVVQGKSPTPPPFSLKQATPTTILREVVRRLHRLTGKEKRIPLLDQLLDTVRS
jgi:glycosyltransferase involved in cell wall biosynthesis